MSKFPGTEHYREIAQSYVDVPDHINPQMLQHYITALCDHIDHLERSLRYELQRKEEVLRICDSTLARIYANGLPAEDLSILALWERVRAALSETPKQEEEEK